MTGHRVLPRPLQPLTMRLQPSTPNAISGAFITNIPGGIDIPNALHALKARFSLFAGDFAQALSEATASSLTVKSTFNFTTVNLNLIFETATSTNNVTAAIDNTTLGLPAGLQPDPADKRLPFYTTTTYNSKILGICSCIYYTMAHLLAGRK